MTITNDQQTLLAELDRNLTLARLITDQLRHTVEPSLTLANVTLIHEKLVELVALARAAQPCQTDDRPDLTVDWCVACRMQTSHRNLECVVCGTEATFGLLLLLEGGETREAHA